MAKKKKSSRNKGNYKEHAGGIDPNDWRIQMHNLESKSRSSTSHKDNNDSKKRKKSRSSKEMESSPEQQQKNTTLNTSTSLPLYKDIIRNRYDGSLQVREVIRNNARRSLYPNACALIVIYLAFYIYDVMLNVKSERYQKYMQNQDKKMKALIGQSNNASFLLEGNHSNGTMWNTTTNGTVAMDVGVRDISRPIIVQERSTFVSKAVLVDPGKLQRIDVNRSLHG